MRRIWYDKTNDHAIYDEGGVAEARNKGSEVVELFAMNGTKACITAKEHVAICAALRTHACELREMIRTMKNEGIAVVLRREADLIDGLVDRIAQAKSIVVLS